MTSLTAMDQASVATALSVGSAVIVTVFTVVVLPLVRYIIVQKDEQVKSMKASLERAFNRIDDLEKENDRILEGLKTRVNDNERELAVLKKEVDLVARVSDDIRLLTERVNMVATEMTSLKAVISERGAYRRTGTPPPAPARS